jgi:hypothetical protein
MISLDFSMGYPMISRLGDEEVQLGILPYSRFWAYRYRNLHF